jgi:hypothetical protein
MPALGAARCAKVRGEGRDGHVVERRDGHVVERRDGHVVERRDAQRDASESAELSLAVVA